MKLHLLFTIIIVIEKYFQKIQRQEDLASRSAGTWKKRPLPGAI